MIGPGAAQPSFDLGDPDLEIVDQLKRGAGMSQPWLGDVKLSQKPAAGRAEEMVDGGLVTECDQRGMDPVLERGAMADQMQPPARQLPLSPNLHRRQPDRRHQIAK